MPLSVIIPVGPGRTAQQAVDSLSHQRTESIFEVLLIGDGADSIAQYPGARYLSTGVKQGRGANVARNLGAAHAQNNMLCFLDDDDAYVPGALDTIAAFMNSASAPQALALRASSKSGRRPEWMPANHYLTEQHLWRRNVAGGCSCMVIHRDTFNKVGGFDEKFPSMQDWDLWLRLSRVAAIERLEQTMVSYNDLGEARISTNPQVRLRGLQMLLEKHRSFWPRRVQAFHEARIAAELYNQKQGRLSAIFRSAAPLASLWYLWTATRRSRHTANRA